MTDIELNKRIHEIMGLKYYEGPSEEDVWYNYNFLTEWRAFGLMWEFMQKHKQREEFIREYGGESYYSNIHRTKLFMGVKFISPRPFAEAMVNFFEKETKL